MDEDTEHRILSISLRLRPFFDEQHNYLLTRFKESSSFQRVEDSESAIRALREEPRPFAVLITDEALTLRENAHVWDTVLKYVQQGGRAVVMGHFARFVRQLDISPFFAKAGLQWEPGPYQRTTLVLNSQAVGADMASKLLPKYSQKAQFLTEVETADAWYVTNEDSLVENLDFVPYSAHSDGESPVLFASVGEGKLGYVGDVHNEEGSEAVVLAMCGL